VIIYHEKSSQLYPANPLLTAAFSPSQTEYFPQLRPFEHFFCNLSKFSTITFSVAKSFYSPLAQILPLHYAVGSLFCKNDAKTAPLPILRDKVAKKAFGKGIAC
jgi:hypothetical protein